MVESRNAIRLYPFKGTGHSSLLVAPSRARRRGFPNGTASDSKLFANDFMNEIFQIIVGFVPRQLIFKGIPNCFF
jgi:hypothetical protein